MILFKIKETAQINSCHMLLSFGLHVMMALTQENVHYTLNSGPGVMNKSKRVHARIQEILSGGGWGWGGMGSRLDGQKTVWTMFFLVINLFYSLQSGSNGFISEGRRGSNFFQGVGVSIETHITCDFPEGGSGPPNPPLDPHVGSPDATVCLQNQVYQNLNKTQKYHPTTTKRKKSYLLLVEIASADPEGGQGPLKNYKLYGFL